MLVAPAPALARRATRKDVIRQAGNHELTVVYLQNRLGGEISVSATDRSPELSFDTTFVELATSPDGGVGIDRFGVPTLDGPISFRATTARMLCATRT